MGQTKLKECVVCGTMFALDGEKPGRKTCSPECSKIRDRYSANIGDFKRRRLAVQCLPEKGSLLEKTCRICGAKFLAPGNSCVPRICSDRCAKEYIRREIFETSLRFYMEKEVPEGMRRCETCGKAFFPNACHQKYCSVRCCREQDRRQSFIKQTKNLVPKRTCVVCGKPFKPWGMRKEACSPECYKKLAQHAKQIQTEKTQLALVSISEALTAQAAPAAPVTPTAQAARSGVFSRFARWMRNLLS